jgi:hypothetical protein
MKMIVAIALALSVSNAPALDQGVDFSGEWTWDAARSDHHPAAEKMVVTQSSAEIRIHQTLCCRQAGEEWIITYPFNGWGSRNATRGSSATPLRGTSDTKPTQARWDGGTLIMHAGPEMDVRGGSVRLWRLAPNGNTFIEEIINRGLGLRFDFKEASIPMMYTRDKHVYVRRGSRDGSR